jgi:hypothetical protein
MQHQIFGDMHEGMEVVDLDGDKIGKVDKIFQPAAVSSTASSTAERAGEPILKVSSGLLGLGKDYYIPAGAVRDVTTDRVVLDVDKDAIDTLGWDMRPPWISD